MMLAPFGDGFTVGTLTGDGVGDLGHSIRHLSNPSNTGQPANSPPPAVP